MVGVTQLPRRDPSSCTEATGSTATRAISGTISRWYLENARDLPWRAPGYGAWGVLVSEIMLQQTQVSRTELAGADQEPARGDRVSESGRASCTPAALAAEPPSAAVRMWDRLGYPRRALALHAAATVIAEQHGDVVPDDVDALLALPGIGDYTARAVAVFAYGQRHPVVDTNVRRVLARALRGVGEAGPPATRRDLAEMAAVLPEDVAASTVVNAGVMELGQVVCTARNPRCDVCPVAHLCAWRAAGYPVYDGPAAPKQARFEGSDRQVRGRIMAELRASDVPVSRTELAGADQDPARVDRVLAGLVADGLAVGDARVGWRLPG